MLETTHQRPALTHEETLERDRDFTAFALPAMPNVKRYALSLTRNESDADDIVQETYLRAYRYWTTFENASDCRKWLLTICRNVFTNTYHREQRSVAVDDDELESIATARTHIAARAAGVDDIYDRVDLGPAIRDAIDRLNSIFREVVLLSDVEGFSYEEIAAALSIPMGTVRSRLFRGRRHLQESLMAYALDAGFSSAKSAGPARRLPTSVKASADG